MAISTAQFTAIADNIAKLLVDMEAAFITSPAAAVTTINNGLSAASNSLYARLAALSVGDQAGKIGIAWQKPVAKVTGYNTVTKSLLYAHFQEYLEALDYDMDGTGVAHFCVNNGILVHPEFAAAFNQMSQSGRTLGLRKAPVPPITPASIMLAADQTLASVAVTGAAAGTFSAGTALDLTQFAGPLQLYIKNLGAGATGGTATSITVTYVPTLGATSTTATQALSGALAAGAKLAVGVVQGISVSAITVNSGGVAADSLGIVVSPPRAIAY